MLAVIDETTPFVAGGICYGVVSGILLTDEDEARSIVRAGLPVGRRRPFHWHEEGIAAKTAMAAAITKIGIIARTVVVPCGRRSQDRARAVAMEETIVHLLSEGCDRVLIERRTPAQDGREREQILEMLRRLGVGADFSYAWRSKSEPLLWLADAIGGAVHDHLVGGDDKDGWYGRIAERTASSPTGACRLDRAQKCGSPGCLPSRSARGADPRNDRSGTPFPTEQHRRAMRA